MAGLQHPSPYLLAMKTSQSTFMFAFEADTEDEARRFVMAWVERHPVKSTSRVTLAKLGDASIDLDVLHPSVRPTVGYYIEQQARLTATAAAR